ncbi:unnamed protein product [Echinostoma caproni]|uniref:Secreted protein n=1 Tax=Echinostoma caproni TaxID=27848 RepID=A0A3P8GMH5_9TREM|nr:unnamed protein product [Echinostoma caproni]
MQMSFCLMAFLVGNLVEGQLLSTGAFEIYYNGELYMFPSLAFTCSDIKLSFVEMPRTFDYYLCCP